MLELALEVALKKPLIFFRKSLKIKAKFLATKSEQIPLNKFLKELYSDSSFIPFPCFPLETAENTITNFRGRSIDEFYQSPCFPEYSLEKPKQEEILFLSGEITQEIEDEEEKSKIIISKVPFSYRINSNFKNFQNNTDIVYDLKYTMNPELEDLEHLISRKKFAQLEEANLNCIRIGFASFKQSSFGGMLGIVPVVKEKFSLVITPNLIILTAENNYLDKEVNLPFAKFKVLEKVDNALEACNLYNGFIKEISKKIKL